MSLVNSQLLHIARLGCLSLVQHCFTVLNLFAVLLQKQLVMVLWLLCLLHFNGQDLHTLVLFIQLRLILRDAELLLLCTLVERLYSDVLLINLFTHLLVRHLKLRLIRTNIFQMLQSHTVVIISDLEFGDLHHLLLETFENLGSLQSIAKLQRQLTPYGLLLQIIPLDISEFFGSLL